MKKYFAHSLLFVFFDETNTQSKLFAKIWDGCLVVLQLIITILINQTVQRNITGLQIYIMTNNNIVLEKMKLLIL
jgi:hypothetical protein